MNADFRATERRRLLCRASRGATDRPAAVRELGICGYQRESTSRGDPYAAKIRVSCNSIRENPRLV
jgi:hypothetical protein